MNWAGSGWDGCLVKEGMELSVESTVSKPTR